MSPSREQQLVDLMFEMSVAWAMSDNWHPNRDEAAAWVADKLKNCGFETRPKGSSWGVLVDKREPEWT